MWVLFTISSTVFAALTSILAKIGISGVNPNLATAIRMVVVVFIAWGIIFITSTQSGIDDISRKSWLFLILSGLVIGASWLFYYHALRIGDTSKVASINKLSVVITLILAFVFLDEQLTLESILGCLLIVVGSLLTILQTVQNDKFLQFYHGFFEDLSEI